MSAAAREEKFRLIVDDEITFNLTREQMRLIADGPNEESFHTCKTDTSFEEFDSAISLISEDVNKIENQLSVDNNNQFYEDITPVSLESDSTQTQSFSECTANSEKEVLLPSPRKLETLARVTEQFNLVHGSKKKMFLLNSRETNSVAISQSTNKSIMSNHDKSDETLLFKNGVQQKRFLKPPSTATTSKTIQPADSQKENIRRDLNESLDIERMSTRLLKTNLSVKNKKLQEQSFKNTPVKLDKLTSPKTSNVKSKVANFIRGTNAIQKTDVQTKSSLEPKVIPSASKIPRKGFYQSARVFGRPIATSTQMKSPGPLITIHKHTKDSKDKQIRINESIYETFEARIQK